MSSYPPTPPAWIVNIFLFIVGFLLLGTWVVHSRSIASWVCFIGFIVFAATATIDYFREWHKKQVQREQWRLEREARQKAQRERVRRIQEERKQQCKRV